MRDPIEPQSDQFNAWLTENRKAWASSIDESQLAWHQKAKLKAGAHATLLWLQLQFDPNSPTDPWRFDSHAIGDCCLFVVRNNETIQLFPITDSQEFTNNPATLASVKSPTPADGWRMTSGFCREGDLIVLSSDAMSAWAVRELEQNRQPDWEWFWDVPMGEFEDRVIEMRNENIVRYDDTTLLMLRIGSPPTEEDSLTKIVDGVRSKWSDVASSFTGRWKRGD